MASRMNEFREFVSKYPKLREEVRKGNRTWQSIYEEWVLYGEGENWQEFRNQSDNNQNKLNPLKNVSSLKDVFGYMKKINPDDLNRTLNTVQKVIQIAQTVGGSKTASTLNAVNSVYNDWWD